MRGRAALAATVLLIAACGPGGRREGDSAQSGPSASDVPSATLAPAAPVRDGGDGPAAQPESVGDLIVRAGSPYRTRANAALAALAARADEARGPAAALLADRTAANGAARFLRDHATDAETSAIASALATAPDGRADDLIAALGRVRSQSAATALVAVILGADGRRAILAGEAIHANPVAFDRAALVAVTAASEPPARRQAALLALGGAPEAGDAPLFVEASQSLSPPFRAVAAGAVVRLPDPPRDVVVRLLADADLSVREAAARACAELKTPWAAEVLAVAFADKASDMRFAAIQAAGSLGAPALAPLVEVVKNDRERAGLRGEALRSLARIDRTAALAALGDAPALFSGELRSMFAESFGVPPR